MKKIFKRSLTLFLVLASFSFTAAACNKGNGSTAEVPPPDSQVTIGDEQPEQTPSEGGNKRPGGLVDMGDFESKH